MLRPFTWHMLWPAKSSQCPVAQLQLGSMYTPMADRPQAGICLPMLLDALPLVQYSV